MSREKIKPPGPSFLRFGGFSPQESRRLGKSMAFLPGMEQWEYKPTEFPKWEVVAIRNRGDERHAIKPFKLP